MRRDRRNFIKMSGLTALGLGSGLTSVIDGNIPVLQAHFSDNKSFMKEPSSIIGQYGPWASSRLEGVMPEFSFRARQWRDLEQWRKAALKRTLERMAVPEIGPTPAVKVTAAYDLDGLHVEELTWQLPYGRPTEAILLKPANAKGRLPGILAFHDHGGNKYFGTKKITRTRNARHPMMAEHQEQYYAGKAWANEIASRGYVVLVSDAFTFGSRRVMLEDVPQEIRDNVTDGDPNSQTDIDAYNRWAGVHEHIMAKSLFCAGLTWPGVFFAEDRVALDILCGRPDVDSSRVGCAGLSGGGLRTVLMGGLDHRIRCAVTVGFMTTWKDFLINKSYTHTWMAYIPLLPNELDFPEILGLRAPLPALVLNDIDDFLYTMPEMKKADEILASVYEKAGARDNYRGSFYPGPHKFDDKMQAEAFAWFDRWLK